MAAGDLTAGDLAATAGMFCLVWALRPFFMGAGMWTPLVRSVSESVLELSTGGAGRLGAAI